MTETLLDMSQPSVLLFISAFFYILVIVILAIFFKQVRSELMTAFNAFLYSMAIFHVFMAVGMYINNTALIHIGIFAALTGSAFTLKFPLSSFSWRLRQIGFYSALLLAWGIALWSILFSVPIDLSLKLALFYMIIFTGGAGFYTIWVGLRSRDLGVKIKCLGGGGGLVTCCFAADLLVVFQGVTIFGEFLMSVAPLIVLAGLILGRRFQRESELQENIPTSVQTIPLPQVANIPPQKAQV